MIDTRRLLGGVLIAVAVLSACSDDEPSGPTFTTTARLVSTAPDGQQPSAEALEETSRVLGQRMSSMGLFGGRARVDGSDVLVTIPGKQEQLMAAVAVTGRLAFREVAAGPVEATGTDSADAEEAGQLRQSADLLADGTRAERAITRALEALNCDDAEEPLRAADDPAMPLAACERKPAEGAARVAYVLGSRVLDNSAIQRAKAEPTPDDVGYQILIEFTSQGRELWSEFTAALAQEGETRGEPARVAFVLDTEVVSAPTVTQRIDGNTRVTGQFTRDEAEALAGVLNTQPLPLSFDVTDVQVRPS